MGLDRAASIDDLRTRAKRRIPRFAFEKFEGAEPVLTTAMKSVGEVMAIGRTFKESLSISNFDFISNGNLSYHQ